MSHRLWPVIAAAGAFAVVTTVAAGAKHAADPFQPASQQWPMALGDWRNTRYSTLTAIDTKTIAGLGGAWTQQLDGASRAVPVVHDGLMFVTAGTLVYALNAKTGAIVWTYKPTAAPSALLKGVAIGEGLAYVGLSNADVVALKEKTGELVWRGSVGDAAPAIGERTEYGYVGEPRTGQYVSAAPTYANGLLISGLSNGDYEIRGRVVALDAKTGKQVWRFDTVPGPGQVGHDTWSQDNDTWQRGGGGVWMTPAIDAQLGLVYIGVGNPVPPWGGELRPGDNLYTESLVALDLKTGKYRWHYQLIHHDIWEFDLGTPIVLFDANVKGNKRKAVAVMRTDGYLFQFDARNGKPIWPIEERAVKQNPRLKTAATQPFPIGAEPLAPECLEKGLAPEGFILGCTFTPIDFDTPNVLTPHGITRAAPMAYSPATGHFYVTGSVNPFWIRRAEDPNYFFPPPGVPGAKSYGLIAAVDSKTNRIVWRRQMPNLIANGSGFLATAGGVLFHGEPDGTVQAYDAATGNTLWQFQTGASIDGSVSTYAIDGEQYVAVMSARNVWAFKLGGQLPPAAAPRVPPSNEIPGVSFAGRVVATDQVAMGALVSDMGLGTKKRQTFDEYLFRPQRVKVKVGATVTWTNTGKITHTAAAADGSWTTGPIPAGGTGTVRFDKAGTYTYICTDHPWTFAEIVVE